MVKFVRGGAAAVLIAAGLAVFAASPARANTQPTVTVKQGPTITKSYPPLEGQGGASEQANYPVPSDCAQPPGQAWCDAIPVTVQLPKDFNPDTDEYITHVVLSWDDHGSAAGQEEVNDMDLFLYDSKYALTGKANDTTDPEKSAAADSHFTVVVLNATGPNTGYTLSFTFAIKRFTPVTEKPFYAGGDTSGSDSTVTTIPASNPTPTTSVMSPLDLPPLDLTDPDFANGIGSQLTNSLFTGSPKQAIDEQGPAKPVGAGILILTLVGLPGVGLGVGAFMFRRRASRLLEL